MSQIIYRIKKMIKPIKTSSLNTTKHAYFECSKCNFKDEIYFENKLINTDDENDLNDLNETKCPNCGESLND